MDINIELSKLNSPLLEKDTASCLRALMYFSISSFNSFYPPFGWVSFFISDLTKVTLNCIYLFPSQIFLIPFLCLYFLYLISFFSQHFPVVSVSDLFLFITLPYGFCIWSLFFHNTSSLFLLFSSFNHTPLLICTAQLVSLF